VAADWIRAKQETVLALIGKGAPKPQITYSFTVTIAEAGLTDRKPLIAVLDDFAFRATTIIELFDT
jgi:hypothetical protein